MILLLPKELNSITDVTHLLAGQFLMLKPDPDRSPPSTCVESTLLGVLRLLLITSDPLHGLEIGNHPLTPLLVSLGVLRRNRRLTNLDKLFPRFLGNGQAGRVRPVV